MASILFDELQNVKDEMPIWEYLKLLNRVAVIYADRYQFQEAYNVVFDNIKYLELIRKTYSEVAYANKMVSEDSVRMKALARAYSACGRYMTFLNMGNPMEMFEKALAEFGNEDTGNRNITICHILNYAIETENRAVYEKYGELYFYKQKRLEDIMDSIFQEDVIDLYRLYILLKGIYKFYLKLINDIAKEKISNMIYEKRLIKEASHPAQLIYRYIALILYKKDTKFSADVETALLHSMNCIDNAKIDSEQDLTISMCITYQTMAIYHELKEQNDNYNNLKVQFKKHCMDSGWEELAASLQDRTLSHLLSLDYA